MIIEILKIFGVLFHIVFLILTIGFCLAGLLSFVEWIVFYTENIIEELK